jgi:hypothetical protein
MILTWQERCEIHPDHQDGMVSHLMIQARMQEEIDELRQLYKEKHMKPVAYMTRDGYVYGQHETRPVDADIPLYTKPFFSQKPSAMMFTSPSLPHPEFTTTCGPAVINHPNWTPLYDHGLREVTDGEILNIYLEQTNGNRDLDILEFARAILKKASEK